MHPRGTDRQREQGHQDPAAAAAAIAPRPKLDEASESGWDAVAGRTAAKNKIVLYMDEAQQVTAGPGRPGEGDAAHGERLGGDARRRGGGGRQVAGRSFDKAAKRSPLHLAQAFAAEARVTPGQVAVDGEVERDPGGARAAAADRHRRQGGDGGRVYAQRETARTVLERGGDYVLAVAVSRCAIRLRR